MGCLWSRDHVVSYEGVSEATFIFAMTSWTIEEPGPDHRFKGFYKSNFSEPTRDKQESNLYNNRHGLVQHFVEPGIETKGEKNQLAYGSDTKYSYEIQKRASFR